MEIIQRLVPTRFSNIRPQIPMNPKYITIHETANASRGADSEAHARLLERGNTRTASWHFTVDENQVIQHIPTNEVAWHAGDGRNGPGNRQSIGIELCINSDGNFTKTKENAVWLIRYLMEKYDIPLSHVVPHRKWTGKDCPHNILPHWNQFVEQIKGAGSTPQTKPSTPKPQPTKPSNTGQRLLKLTSPMMNGDDIKKVQKLLGIKADGIFGPQTQTAVKQFQKSRGLDIDGIVGPLTMKALLNPPKYPGHLIKRGSEGENVKMIQRRLSITVDGVFGPVTETAIKRFQKSHGLDVDGIVGPQTWNALF